MKKYTDTEKLFFEDDLCNLKWKNIFLNEPVYKKCDLEQLEIIKEISPQKEFWEIKWYNFSRNNNWEYFCQKEINTKILKPLELKRCKEWEFPWAFYQNCCPSAEFDVYLVQKIFFKNKENIFEFIGNLRNFSETEQKNIIKWIIEKEKEKFLKLTETKKEVIIPVDKPLTVEQMWLLEATIYATFTIWKIIFR